jgi:hypothetical protein
MNKLKRYRVEDGVACVDVKAPNIEHLFDRRDAAPFRERDLDPALAEYLQDASEDLQGQRFRLVFWLEQPCLHGEIEGAVRAHFEYVLERIRRQRRQHRRTGQVALFVGIFLIGALLSFAQLLPTLLPGALGAALREGLVILSWIVMWRPVEILIYDWIPARHERRIVARLLEAPAEVRIGGGPELAVPARSGEQRERRP